MSTYTICSLSHTFPCAHLFPQLEDDVYEEFYGEVTSKLVGHCEQAKQDGDQEEVRAIYEVVQVG